MVSSSVDEALEARLLWARENVGLKIIPKSESVFMKVLYYGALMFVWQRRFMTDYHTTIGRRMYISRPLEGVDGLAVLNHELQHVEDSRRFGPLWTPLYLFPQILALGAIAGVWWKPALVLLVALAPWPAPFRVWAEARGYDETLRTYLRWGVFGTPDFVDYLKTIFTGWAYYRMAWRWTPLRRRFEELLRDG